MLIFSEKLNRLYAIKESDPKTGSRTEIPELYYELLKVALLCAE